MLSSALALVLISSTPNDLPSQLAWSDFDHDGLQDVLAIHPDGSTQLLRNEGRPGFQDVTNAALLTPGPGTREASWVDLNADGWDDLLLAGETATSTFFVAFFSFLWVERETRAFWICLSSLFCSLITEQLALTTSSLVVEKTRGRRTTITTTTTTTHEFLDS